MAEALAGERRPSPPGFLATKIHDHNERLGLTLKRVEGEKSEVLFRHTRDVEPIFFSKPLDHVKRVW